MACTTINLAIAPYEYPLESILDSVCNGFHWLFQALIDEDRLLSRIEVLENQIQVFSKVRWFLLLNENKMHIKYIFTMFCIENKCVPLTLVLYITLSH